MSETSYPFSRDRIVAVANERENVEEMFESGTEPLVVVDTAREPPRYGQDVRTRGPVYTSNSPLTTLSASIDT